MGKREERKAKQVAKGCWGRKYDSYDGKTSKEEEYIIKL